MKIEFIINKPIDIISIEIDVGIPIWNISFQILKSNVKFLNEKLI